jgi:hypothetical protein
MDASDVAKPVLVLSLPCFNPSVPGNHNDVREFNANLSPVYQVDAVYACSPEMEAAKRSYAKHKKPSG